MWTKTAWEEAEERRKRWSEQRERDKVDDHISLLWDEVFRLRDEIEEIRDETTRQQVNGVHHPEGGIPPSTEEGKNIFSLREMGGKRGLKG